jgi:tryptophan synthase alpha chain
MNRINKKFKDLQARKKKAFISFITAGDPSLKVTEELVLAFDRVGVDIIELGIPFSDPLADGTTIQASYQRALKNKVTIEKILDSVWHMRKKTQVPITLMTSYNIIYHYGEKELVEQAKNSGVDGLIIPDLPPEEARNLIGLAKKRDISTIFFLSPTTTDERMKFIVKNSTGFIYYISLMGVTGARRQLSRSLKPHLQKARALSKKPICVGFGISTALQVKEISKVSDGVIVGSSIINKIARNKGKRHLVQNVSRHVRALMKG